MIGRNNKEMFPAGWSDIMKDNSLRILHKEIEIRKEKQRNAKECIWIPLMTLIRIKYLQYKKFE